MGPLGEQGPPVPGQRPSPPALQARVRAGPCCCFWFLLELSFLLLRQKAKQSSGYPNPTEKMGQLSFRWDLFPCFFHCFAFRINSPPPSYPPWAAEQKHHNDPPLSFLLLVNYFISFL